MSALDHVTVLRAVDGAVLTKRVKRALDNEWLVASYDQGFWFSVEEVPVNDLIDLGVLLHRLTGEPKACVIRGRPLPGINRRRTWRLLYATVDDTGRERAPTFEAATRRSMALDFDNLPVPTWCPEGLARRRAAIERDRAEHGLPAPEGADDGEDIDLAGDGDPAPVDPVKDWALVVRTAVSTLPAEFHHASAFWTMTSSAGLKPGIRLRLWYWLDRAVDDQACKRWLADAPVDLALYSPVQAHYTAAPIFANPDDDPVPIRSGWWWRPEKIVRVPDLPEPVVEPVEPVEWEPLAADAEFMAVRARAYADAALTAVRTASAGDRHPTLMAVALRLYSLANIGLLDPGDVTRQLTAAGEAPLTNAERIERCTPRGVRGSANDQAIDWARAKAKASPDLPEGFRR